MIELHHQEHLLRFWDELTQEEKLDLEREISEIDWDLVKIPSAPEEFEGEISPIEILTVQQIEREKKIARKIGEDAIREGKVAAVLLAGGQGTRLGIDAPKGTFDVGISKPLYIFELLIKNLLSVTKECGEKPPFLIMTSEKNDALTRNFFAEHRYFGYPEDKIKFFVQKMAPCVDLSGNLLLEQKGKLARSPNGNGGWYSSLKESKILEEFPSVEWFNVFGVDNVLQRIADPVFLGATILSGANCGAKGVLKNCPEEKVGVLCLKDGLPSVIEYYDLKPELANARNASGQLVYSFGVTLNYLFNRKKLEQVSSKPLPVHLAKKKIPYLDEKGEMVFPEKENGYKFETLILDLVRLMETCLPFEIVREREFAPIKNKTGVDSVESARELLKFNGVMI